MFTVDCILCLLRREYNSTNPALSSTHWRGMFVYARTVVNSSFTAASGTVAIAVICIWSSLNSKQILWVQPPLQPFEVSKPRPDSTKYSAVSSVITGQKKWWNTRYIIWLFLFLYHRKLVALCWLGWGHSERKDTWRQLWLSPDHLVTGCHLAWKTTL